jgi:DNA polymerase III epsilon subunit-like protein
MLDWLSSLLGKPYAASDAPLDSLRYVLLDTELTSLDPRCNRLLSIGAIVMEGTKIRLGEHMYRIVNPGEAIPVETIVIHGLRPADVERGCDPGKAVEELFQFIGDSIIVGHFVHIDLQVLRNELRRASRRLPNPAIDTARVHYWLAASEARRRGVEDVNEPLNLATLAVRYQLQVEEAHHALHDAFLTAQLWQKMLPRLAERGVKTLKDVLHVARG